MLTASSSRQEQARRRELCVKAGGDAGTNVGAHGQCSPAGDREQALWGRGPRAPLLGPPSLSPLGLTQLGHILEPWALGKCCQGELCWGATQGVKVWWL